MCEDIGFTVRVMNTKKWESIPIQSNKLVPEFINLSDNDLLVSEAHLVMTHLR